MSNMSYCRFENTAMDMQDCIDALESSDWNVELLKQKASSGSEAEAIDEFIELCCEVADSIKYLRG